MHQYLFIKPCITIILFNLKTSKQNFSLIQTSEQNFSLIQTSKQSAD